MTNFKSTRSALLSSAVALFVCFAMLLGTTFAWFTDSVTSASNIIKTGNLDVTVEYTLGDKDENGDLVWKSLDGAEDLFQKGLWEPGHTEVVALRIKNEGSLALKYKAALNLIKETVGKTKDGTDIVLSELLTVSTLVQQMGMVGDIAVALAFKGENGVAYEQTAALGESFVLRADQQLLPGDAHYLIVKVDMPEAIGNEAMHDGVNMPSIELGINVLVAQLNYEEDGFGSDYDKDAEYPSFVDTWDGEVDLSWYLEDPNATEFTLQSAEALAGLAALVDGSVANLLDATSEITLPVTFEGKTVYLDSDVDLYFVPEGATEPACFDPIGSYRKDTAFSGVFDGQGHTIRNLNQNTWELDNGYYYGDLGLGLFGLVEDATVKDLVVDGASISGESAIVGIVAGCAYGECTFENITVSNSRGADYQYYAGGIVGWASGKHSYVNCNVDATTTLAAQWGDFDNSTGGLIGGAGGSAEILMKDCTVACRIDAYNDVTSTYQWYAYRRCGMLIGNTGKTVVSESGSTIAAAPQLTCENVTVTYGDWANYTYCEFAGTSWPYVRVQAGVSNSAYSNPRYGHPTDANGNEVVDDNHVHNEGEDHFILCVFDQLYGGGQGVYGCPTHDGVTVIYENK